MKKVIIEGRHLSNNTGISHYFMPLLIRLVKNNRNLNFLIVTQDNHSLDDFNLFDNVNLSTVTTATKLSVVLKNGGVDPMLPNVATEIFSITGIPEVQNVDMDNITSHTGTNWGRITDGTTTISKQVDIDTTGDNDGLNLCHKLIEAFRNDEDYCRRGSNCFHWIDGAKCIC